MLPANTDGSNHWQQGRILVTPDNQNTGDASGSMYLQTRYSIPNAWAWRNNLVLKSNGNVGIGIADPSTELHIEGKMMINQGVIQRGGTPITNTNDLGLYSQNSGNWVRLVSNNAPIRFFTEIGDGGIGSDVKLTIEPNGQVGIGTIEMGSHKLAVEGSIIAREIKVQASGWSDFVFEESYDLPSLEQVEVQIKEKGHLKDIPSAAEVAENGIYLGEMDAKLLQKIEELTLYMIDMNKKNDDSARRNFASSIKKRCFRRSSSNDKGELI